LRVSTGEQDVDHQRAECYRAAERGFSGAPVVEYVDHGVSASKTTITKREAASRLMAAIESGDVCGVVTWNQDRLSRGASLSEGQSDIAVFLHICTTHGVPVWSATEGELRQDAFSHRLVTSLRELLAEDESAKKAERSRSGQLALARAGKWPNGPTPPGYDRDATTKRLVENDTAPFIREAFKRFDRGESRASLASWLTDTTAERWDRHRVRDLLRNAAYVGVIEHGGETHPGLHEPLVTQELFDRVQDRLHEDAARHQRKNRRSPFGALLRCACSAQLQHHSERRRGLDHHDYECRTCGLRLHAEGLDLSYSLLMAGVSQYLREHLADPTWRSEADPTEEETLRAALADLLEQRKNLLTIAATGDTVAANMAEERRLASDTINRRLRRLTASWESKRDQLQVVASAWHGFRWPEATVEERLRVVRATTESLAVEQSEDGAVLLVRPFGFPAALEVELAVDSRRAEPHRHIRRLGYGMPEVPPEAADPS
jgi:DNA invertase Pin-like site-specific DNA recombinase